MADPSQSRYLALKAVMMPRDTNPYGTIFGDQPVYVGDVLSFWTEVVRVGTTSITMHVLVEAEREGKPTKLTEAEITYVAVRLEGDQRRPVPIRGEGGTA